MPLVVVVKESIEIAGKQNRDCMRCNAGHIARHKDERARALGVHIDLRLHDFIEKSLFKSFVRPHPEQTLDTLEPINQSLLLAVVVDLNIDDKQGVLCVLQIVSGKHCCEVLSEISVE